MNESLLIASLLASFLAPASAQACMPFTPEGATRFLNHYSCMMGHDVEISGAFFDSAKEGEKLLTMRSVGVDMDHETIRLQFVENVGSDHALFQVLSHPARFDAASIHRSALRELPFTGNTWEMTFFRDGHPLKAQCRVLYIRGC